jgi:hypothetical protein
MTTGPNSSHRRRRAAPLAVSVLILSTGVAVASALGSPAAASTGSASPCVPYQLPAGPGNSHGEVITMTDTGIYVGAAAVASGAGHAAWWTHTGSDLSTGWQVHPVDIPGSDRSEFLDVNASGVMSGFTYDLGQGFVYDSTTGALTWLPDLAGGYQSWARRINASGVVTGNALDAEGDPFAAIWRPPYTHAERVHAPGENKNYTLPDGTHVKIGSETDGINDEGTVAGLTFLGGPVHDVAQWARSKQWHDAYAPLLQGFAKSADGEVTRLPAGYDQAYGFAINNDGLVVGGSMRDASLAIVPAYWRDGVEHDMGAPDDTVFGQGYMVSQGGWATGGVIVSDTQRSFVWTGAGNLRLNEPLPGYNDSWSHGVNDVLRQVAGGSQVSPDDRPVPTVWQCPTGFTTG